MGPVGNDAIFDQSSCADAAVSIGMRSEGGGGMWLTIQQWDDDAYDYAMELDYCGMAIDDEVEFFEAVSLIWGH